MRIHIPFAGFILVLLSCTQQNNTLSPKPDHVSKFFIENEDSLYSELVTLAERNLGILDQNKFGYASSHQSTNTYMGRFTSEVKKDCEGLEVVFSYDKSLKPKGSILVSTGYDRRFSKALDTILNFVPNSKYFKITKYDNPEFYADTDILSLDMGDIHIKDLRINMTPVDTLQNVTVYIRSNLNKKNFTESDSLFLRSQLFGERMYVQKINSLNFSFNDSINSGLLTIIEARSKLK